MSEKYYIGLIEERNGERDYTHHVFYTAPNFKEACARHTEMASDFYGEPYAVDTALGEYDYGDVIVREGCVWEVSKATYMEAGRHQ